MANEANSGRLALVVGGGPAPGINGVISSVTIEAINHGIEVVGIYDGFQWLVQGDISQIKMLSIDDVNRIQLRGGSILRTSRTNPAKSEADMRNVLHCLHQLRVTSLVTISWPPVTQTVPVEPAAGPSTTKSVVRFVPATTFSTAVCPAPPMKNP